MNIICYRPYRWIVGQLQRWKSPATYIDIQNRDPKQVCAAAIVANQKKSGAREDTALPDLAEIKDNGGQSHDQSP